MTLKKLIYWLLLPFAVLAVGMNATGYEREATALVPVLLVLWGSVGVLEYAKGKAIQVTCYRVEGEATRGERFLHLLLSIMLISVGIGVLFKHVL